MAYLSSNIFNLVFKAVCLTATLIMVGYWIMKFLRNEDVSVIDYQSLETVENPTQPEFSICLENPFKQEKFNGTGTGIQVKNYLAYLGGHITGDDTYKDIDFDDVSINLFDYLETVKLDLRQGNNQIKKTCTDINNCPFVIFKNNFNGFPIGLKFFKCFGVEVSKPYARVVTRVILVFSSRLTSLLKAIGGMRSMVFHYPQQMLVSQGADDIWLESNETNKILMIKMKTVEILKRRNKFGNPCLLDWMHYDDSMYQKHMEGVGCRTPYQTQNIYKNIFLCESQMKMKQSIMSNFRSEKRPPPCEGISNMVYRIDNVPLDSNPESPLYFKPLSIPFVVEYQDKIKVITQSQMVDLQALVGYIGGYIGLFLGKNICK